MRCFLPLILVVPLLGCGHRTFDRSLREQQTESAREITERLISEKLANQRPYAEVGVSLVVQGDSAYVGVGPYLVIVDVADRRQPTVVGYTRVVASPVFEGGELRALAVEGGYVYVVSYSEFGHNSLVIVDVSDAAAPRKVGAYEMVQIPEGLAVAGEFVHLYTGSSLTILNVSGPTHPERIPVVGFHDQPQSHRHSGQAVDARWLARIPNEEFTT